MDTDTIGRTAAPLPSDEIERLRSLSSFDIVDTPAEDVYDDLAALAALSCGAAMAAVSLLDVGRQWCKAAVGLPVRQTRRDVSFCSWAVLDPTRTLVVPDAARDERFARNPMVTGAPWVRAYAGAPLVTSDGHPLGALAVLDTRPRTLDGDQVRTLEVLAAQVVAQLELRRARLRNADLQQRLHVWETVGRGGGTAVDMVPAGGPARLDRSFRAILPRRRMARPGPVLD